MNMEEFYNLFEPSVAVRTCFPFSALYCTFSCVIICTVTRAACTYSTLTAFNFLRTLRSKSPFNWKSAARSLTDRKGAWVGKRIQYVCACMALDEIFPSSIAEHVIFRRRRFRPDAGQH